MSVGEKKILAVSALESGDLRERVGQGINLPQQGVSYIGIRGTPDRSQDIDDPRC